MDEATEAQEPQSEEKSEAKGLRAQVESLSRENRELKAEKRDGILEELGLNPNEGMGLVLTEQFDRGDLRLEDIRSTAIDKYGVSAPTTPEPQHPQAQTIQGGHDRLENLDGAAGSIAPPTQQEALAKAEADKDYATTMAYKTRQLGEMLKDK